MDIHIYHHFHDETDGSGVADRLDHIQTLLGLLIESIAVAIDKEDGMTQQLQQLRAEVEAATKVEESAVALIQGLAAKIEALKDDPAQLQELADSLRASDQLLADAVLANTTPAPSPVEPPL